MKIKVCNTNNVSVNDIENIISQWRIDQPMGNVNISLEFNTESERDEVFDKLPKSVRLIKNTKSVCGQDNKTYTLNLNIQRLNSKTGEANESGEKRMKSLIKHLSRE